jgi:hypothetical protein
MNIFALSDCPVQSAKWHNNKHCVKMVTEIQQCLSCAVIRHSAPTELLPLTKSGNPVKGGYHHHPSSIWAGNTKGNFIWLCKHGLALAKEYTERYGKTHFCEAQIKQLATLVDYIPDGNREDFAIAISDDMECRKITGFNSLSSVMKYRLYYIHDKRHLADWKQNKPDWYILKHS